MGTSGINGVLVAYGVGEGDLQIASAARQALQGHIESSMPRVKEGKCEEVRGTWVLEEEATSLLRWRLMLLGARCVLCVLLSSIIIMALNLDGRNARG